jgi:hypothetical protein
MKLTKLVATLIAVGTGWIVLLGYFLPTVDVFKSANQSILGIASHLAAIVVIVGAINLFLVHTKKLTGNTPGWFYSLFILLGLVAVILLNLAAPFLPREVGVGVGPASTANQFIFKYIQSAAGAAIAGLIFFFLVLAGYRVLGRRMTLATLAFVISGAITLLALAPWPTFLPNLIVDDTTIPVTTLRDVLRTLTLIPSIAGARGLLLGIALGVVATGLRVLLAQDRPYRE